MLKGFRDFILRGNVVDLAVAVLIAAAFGQITTSLTVNIITPFISAVLGAPDFSSLVFHMHVFHQGAAAVAPCVATATVTCPALPGDIHYGIFLNALINFLLVSAVVYFLVVLPLQKLLQRIEGPAALENKACPQCLSEVPVAATRCRFCAQPIP